MLCTTLLLAAVTLQAGAATEQPLRRASQELDRSTLARIELIADEAMAGSGASAMVVLVELDGSPLLEFAVGQTDGRKPAPARVDSAFRVGALCEPMVATCLLQLAGEGQVDLDADIGELLPGLTWEGQPVTLRAVLSHTSGLPSFDAVLHNLDARRRAARPQEAGATVSEDDPTDLVAAISALALEADPGTCFSYEHTNHVVAASILERVSGRTVSECLTAQVFEPLGMADTAFREDGPPLDEVERPATGDAGLLPAHVEHFDEPLLVSTAPDLLLWVQGLTGRELLDELRWRAMSEPAALADGDAGGYGLGLACARLDEHEALVAGGAMAGGRAHVALYADLEMTVVVLGNATDLPAERVGRRVARAILDLPEPGVHDWPLDPEALERYVGDYQIGCTRLDVRVAGDHLTLALEERPTLTLLHQGRHLFVGGADPEVRVQFTVEDGLARSFELDDHGKRAVATRFGD